MDEKKFKKINKPPACTQQPWAHLIHPDERFAVLNKIREESILLHGENMDACPKRKTCFTKACMGRPLPVKSPTFKPYLEQLKKTHTIINDELYINNCGSCQIRTSCKSLCHQMNDWLQRDSDPQPNLIFQENLENYPTDLQMQNTVKEKNLDISLCWEAIPEKKADIIKKYLYQQKDFEIVAKELNISNKALAKYEYYATLNKLAEFSVMRDFLKENQDKLTENQQLILNMVYYGNKTLTQAGKELNISTESVRRTVLRVVEANNLKWPIFVRKEQGKLIYNIPEILK